MTDRPHTKHLYNLFSAALVRLAMQTDNNLYGANLRGANLKYANLEYANLRGAILTDANLRGAKLARANLEGAYLTDAYLTRAKLEGADLRGADLRGAILTDANLRGADLARANLEGADLRGADLARADLARANLTGANLTRAELTGADLARADLARANLEGANLEYADLRGADLEGANLRGAYLYGAILTNTCLDPDNAIDPEPVRQWCAANNIPVDEDGYFVAWRTKESRYVGSTVYEVGQTYTAPWFSTSASTDCHPGLYFATRKYLVQNDTGYDTVAVRVNVRDAVIIPSKGGRCRMFTVVERELDHGSLHYPV